jgi:hypothetical protein
MIDTIVPTALKTTMATDKKLGPDVPPMNIATISAGFEKGDFLVREEQGNRVYFDFFEEVRGSHFPYSQREESHMQVPFSALLTDLFSLFVSIGFQLYLQQRILPHVSRR